MSEQTTGERTVPGPEPVAAPAADGTHGGAGPVVGTARPCRAAAAGPRARRSNA
ncbi:hypothetical protein [Streptomyces sp. AC558_RSS880]|uniref:hypothetical protein n=1 Tax=Streptomyces sp. AC558_RSS880 TaxID=2823687 RepID=UPI001C21C1AC|nr:hypothetical protein [Streptomyces sp. AC558_RSS880]